MLKNDWIISQINQLIRMIANIVFKKNSIDYIVTENTTTEEKNLHNSLVELLSEGKINEGENLLFYSIDRDNLEIFKIGVDYYEKINKLSEEELKNYNFSKNEIKSGLEDLLDEYGFNITI